MSGNEIQKILPGVNPLKALGNLARRELPDCRSMGRQ